MFSEKLDNQLRVCMPSRVRIFTIPWTVSPPLSVKFSRQEYWNVLPFPIPGAVLDPGIEPESPAAPALASRFFYHCATWEAQITS